MSKNKKRAAGSTDKTILKADVISKYLSEFTYSEDKQGMQFVRLDVSDKKVDNLDKAIIEFKHLRYLNFENNGITDWAILQGFENLVHLNLNNNKIKNLTAFITEEGFPKLQKLELANNSISELVPLTASKIEYLDLSNNGLEKYETWIGHPSIKIFKAVKTKVKTMTILSNMPALEEAYLGGTSINSFSGYENLPALKVLHLRDTKISKIEEELPELASIETINLRRTGFNSLDNLKNIFQFTTLKNLNVLETNMEENASSFNMLLAEVLLNYRGLTHFCKVEIADQHKYESLYLAEYRWRKSEEERKRKEKEEEEKLKAEAEGE
jgi:Leucine-rich repeat (LRR) protein